MPTVAVLASAVARAFARTIRLTRRSRQLLLVWAALFALFAAPVAATLHELKHLSAPSSGLDKKQSDGKGRCEVCSAYASLGHALSSAGATDLSPDSIATEFLHWNGSVAPPVHFPYRERAPPSSLNS